MTLHCVGNVAGYRAVCPWLAGRNLCPHAAQLIGITDPEYARGPKRRIAA